MRSRTAARLAWSTLAGAAGLYAATVALALTRSGARPTDDLIAGAGILLFCVVGALVAARVPANPVGWIFCAFGLTGVATVFASELGRYALAARPSSSPVAAYLFWFESVVGNWAPPLLICLVFLLFPTGRPPSRRWRSVAWSVVGYFAIQAAATAFAPGRLSERAVDNPLGIDAARDLLVPVAEATVALIGLMLLISAASLVLRFRSAGRIERQQLKWFAYFGALLAVQVAVGTGLEQSLGSTSETAEFVWFLMFVLLLIGLPVSMGIAILRYRLYDIDRIINRTLVYAALTTVLAAAYVAIVAAASSIAGESDLTIAGATLAVAALFQPLRARIQAFIDRHFYRSRYDAARTVESFSARLRNEVELDAVTLDLLGVVRGTLQPAHASLWLHPEAR